MTKMNMARVCVIIMVFSLCPLSTLYAGDQEKNMKTYVKVIYPEPGQKFLRCDEIKDLVAVDYAGDPIVEFKQYDPIITASAICNSSAFDVMPFVAVEIGGDDTGVYAPRTPYNQDGSALQRMWAEVVCVEPGDYLEWVPEVVYLHCIEY